MAENRQQEDQPSATLTRALERWNAGDPEAAGEAFPLVYDELRQIASAYFRRERRDHTLQATAIVHEAYSRLIEQTGIRWQSRAHFVGLVAHVMRRVLVDYARERGAVKRGGHSRRVTLTESQALSIERPPDLVALDDALYDLAEIDLRKAQIVELKFFGGLTIEETAEQLRVSTPTVIRDWRRAKAWLYRRLIAEETAEGSR